MMGSPLHSSETQCEIVSCEFHAQSVTVGTSAQRTSLSGRGGCLENDSEDGVSRRPHRPRRRRCMGGQPRSSACSVVLYEQPNLQDRRISHAHRTSLSSSTSSLFRSNCANDEESAQGVRRPVRAVPCALLGRRRRRHRRVLPLLYCGRRGGGGGRGRPLPDPGRRRTRGSPVRLTGDRF